MHNNRGRIALIIVGALVLLECYVLATTIYVKPAEGVGVFLGSFAVFAGAAWLFSLPVRKTTYRAAVVIAIGGLGVIISDIGQIVETLEARSAQRVLSTLSDPSELPNAAQQHPDNQLLKAMAVAFEAAKDVESATIALDAAIEPKSVAAPNLATANRQELQQFASVLESAETNAIAAKPKYQAILQHEREQVQASLPSLHLSSSVAESMMKGVEKRQQKETDYTMKMVDVRVSLYHAARVQFEILIEQFGSYRVAPNGQVVFVNQAALDQFNRAATDLAAANAQVQALDAQRKQLVADQQQNWRAVGTHTNSTSE